MVTWGSGRLGRHPAYLLLQTDTKLLGGQGRPWWWHLCGRGRPAVVQVPELLVIPADRSRVASQGTALRPPPGLHGDQMPTDIYGI
jgi:hypothetical protein